MKGHGRLSSIRFRYTLLVLGAALGLAATGVVLMVRLRNEAIRSAGEYAVGNLKTVAISVDEIFRNVGFVFTPLLTSRSFVDLVQDLSFMNPVADYAALVRMQQLEEIMRRSYLSNSYIHSISYWDMANDVAIYARADLQKTRDLAVRATAWYVNHEKLEGREWWTVSRGFATPYTLLSSYRYVRVNDGGWQTKGILSIDIGASVVQTLFSRISLGSRSSAFVLDCLGNLVASVGAVDPAETARIAAAFADPGTAEDYRMLTLDGGPSLVALHASPQSGLRFSAVIPLHDVDTFVPIVLTYIVYTYAALVAVIAAMALITYVSFYRPLSTLFQGMKQLAAGNFTVTLDSGRRDEVGFIYENFNRTVRDLKRLVDENYLIELSRKDARLKMVLSQLNEHFLYNTLDCIHWLARKYDVKEIADVVFALSRFYSMSLSSGRDLIPVRDVVGIIESYLSIQLVRRPDGFRYHCKVPAPLENLTVLKYLFQPLVENAVVHGLSDTVADGRVDVSFQRVDDALRFEVRDNGKGIDPEKLGAIRAGLAAGGEDAGGAFALCNVNTQIRLYYGEPYGLSIESAPGSGTRVWIDIPFARCEPSHA